MGHLAAAGVAAALVGLAALVPAGHARGATAEAAVSLAAQVAGRTALGLDRRVVTLRPGESVLLEVTVRCRLPAGGALEVRLAGDLDPGLGPLVTVTAEGRRAPLAGAVPVVTVRRSGVAVRRVTLTLAAEAPAPVTLGLGLDAAAAF